MDDTTRSFGEAGRESIEHGKQSSGHGVGDVLSRVDRGGKIERPEAPERTERRTSEPTTARDSGPGTNIDGNTSETGTGSGAGSGSGLPIFGGGGTGRRTTLPSPLGGKGGCTAPTATMFITSITLLGAILKHKHR